MIKKNLRVAVNLARRMHTWLCCWHSSQRLQSTCRRLRVIAFAVWVSTPANFELEILWHLKGAHDNLLCKVEGVLLRTCWSYGSV